MKMTNVLTLLLMMATLLGCGSPKGGAATGVTGGGGTAIPALTVLSTASQLNLSILSNTVNSDNSNTSTITATALDANNAVVKGAAVTFSATVGQLSASSGVTDATGKTTVSFSSGISNFNQVATITATLTGVAPALTVQIPVQIVGSTVTLATLTTNLTAATSDTLSVAVKDAGGNPILNAPVTVTQAGAGTVSLAPAILTTDVNGNVSITVTGATAGNVQLTLSAAGATASQAYTVTNLAAAFAVTAPASDPFPLAAGTPVTVTVQAPGAIANVSFATSLGVWNGGLSATTVPVVAGVASATFSSTNAGVATIQVFDAVNIATSDKMQIVISQPAANAAQIILQANVNVVAPSVGGVTNTVTLTATVRDVNGQAVGGSPVAFSIPNSIGGGETVSPVVVMSDSFGKASTTFTSGAVSTGAQGVNVQAILLNKPFVPAAQVNIVIGGTAGSIAIGRASKIVVASTTVYELPMSVLVADSNGNAVAGATVSLKAFPTKFRTGAWFDVGSIVTNTITAAGTATTITPPKFVPCITQTFLNEDVNRDLVLNPGEDVAHPTLGNTCDITTMPLPLSVIGTPVIFAANNLLDPPNSAAGTLPQTIITDASGVANFVLTYLKGSAQWIDTEITASTLVLGSETTARITFTLPVEKTEAVKGILPNSVFGK